MNRKKRKGIDFTARTCIGCRKVMPKSGMVRIVANGNALMVDDTGKAAGRGVYLCRSNDCFSQAVKKKAFQRGFRRSFDDEVLEALREKFLGDEAPEAAGKEE